MGTCFAPCGPVCTRPLISHGAHLYFPSTYDQAHLWVPIFPGKALDPLTLQGIAPWFSQLFIVTQAALA